MVISRQKLIEKATGAAPVEPESPLASPYGKAMLNTLPTAASYEDFLTTSGLMTPVSPSQGLSSKGKYGGFYTTSDLETAIKGEAEQRNAASNAWAESLRNLAAKATGTARQTGQNRYMAEDIGELGGYAREAFPTSLRAPAKALFGGYEAPGQTMAPAERRAEEETYGALAGETLRQKFGAEQTAMQVEDTPMSVYARAIATQRYGMNPALAAGTFGTDYDVEAAQAMREQQFLDAYGMTEQDYRAAQEREYQQGERAYTQRQRLINQAIESGDPTLLAREDLQAASTEVEDLYYLDNLRKTLGVNPKGLLTAANLTPAQAFDAATKPITLGTGEEVSFSSELKNIQTLLQDRNFEDAIAQVSELVYTEAEPIARLLSSYIVNLARIAGKPLKEYATLSELYDIGLQNPDGQ